VYPNLFEKLEESARYPLFVHALKFSDIPGILENTVLPPCAVTLVYVYIAVHLLVQCSQWLFVCKIWILLCCMPSCYFEAKQQR